MIFLGILSSVTQNEHGFEVDRKLNVSISRAQSRLIILGEPAILSKNSHYERILKAVIENGKYIRLDDSYALFGAHNIEEEDFIF